MKMQQVKEYNAKQTQQIMRFTIGGYIGEDRKNGWVVSWGNDSHRLFDNKEEAQEFVNSNK